MNSTKQFSTRAAISCGLLLTCHAQDSLRSLDPLTVHGGHGSMPWNHMENEVDDSFILSGDAASLVGRMPGAAVVRNGPQAGILQLRGLSGDRVGVRVDGMTVTPGCPNHMDPPLHYANPVSGDLISLFAGISPVSEGGDSIGGILRIDRPEPSFSGADGPIWRGLIGASFLGSQDALSLHTDVELAQENFMLGYRGSAATADDIRYPGGTVRATSFEKTHHEVLGAWRLDDGYISIDGGYGLAREAGTPALPMDMIRDESWKFGLRHSQKLSWGTVRSRLYLHDIDHLMDNFTMRPVMPGRMAMESPSTSRDFGLDMQAELPFAGGRLLTGLDTHWNEFDAVQVAVKSGKRRDTFNDNHRDRLGIYADWERPWDAKWKTRAGVRLQYVGTDAGAVSNDILPPGGPMRPMLLMDQARFNSSKRSHSDIWPDLMTALRYEPDKDTALELSMAVKSRAPSMVERYLWTPLSASAGLADGRSYLGNTALDPETAFQVGLGIEKRAVCWDARITPFYQMVDDYIQGMPLKRTDMNGLPVLQFTNLGTADLYGCEFAGGWEPIENLRLDLTVSYVRGKNRDTGDDLYRIAPLRGVMDLGYDNGTWEGHLEWAWAFRQDEVSSVQREPATPGYGILNLRLAHSFSHGLRVEAGVENIFDKYYADHLSGVNRVGGSDLSVGERIPGAGRFAYASVVWRF